MASAGIYIHIPFCSSFCTYCSFYSVVRGSVEGYIKAVIEEARLLQHYFKEGVLPETLYFGGGTPSVLDASQIAQITSAIKDNFCCEGFEEFTIEVNPDDIYANPTKLEEYKNIGINRFSMGVQSFKDEHLKWMNRRHTATQAVKAYELMRAIGIDNISIDLIFGFEHLSRQQWKENISKALTLSPEHISCYQMSIEKNSVLYASFKKGEYREPSQEECAWQYTYLQQQLLEAGYVQYEISNFCKEGYQSHHNSSYWERTPYLGLGPSAHSFDGERERRWNVASVRQYISALLLNNNSLEPRKAAYSSERLSDIEIFNEQVMLGLRKTAGFEMEMLDKQLLKIITPEIESMLVSGDLILEKGVLRIPTDKLFVSDGIMSRLFIV